MKVWKRGHRGSDPSNPDIVHSGGRSSTDELLTYFVTVLILLVLSRLQFALLYRKSIRKKWS
jgi:hypothetical protein